MISVFQRTFWKWDAVRSPAPRLPQPAWTQIDPALHFRDLTLPSLQADLDEESALTVEFSRLKAQLRLRSWDKLKRLKVGIRGTHGDDSPEYKRIGGTRKRERKPYTYKKKE